MPVVREGLLVIARAGSLTRAVIAAVATLVAVPAAAAPALAPSHWVDKSQGLPDDLVTAVAVDPFDPRVIYAGFDGFVFRSDDGGDTFSAVLSFPRGLSDDAALSTQLKDDATGFDEDGGRKRGGAGQKTALDTGDTGTSDGDTGDDLPDGSLDATAKTKGFSVEDIPLVPLANLSVPPHFDPGVRAIAFAPHPGLVLVATPRGLFRSVNGALTFERLGLPGGAAENDIRDVVVDRDRPTRYFVGTGSGLFITKDGGVSFERADGRLGTTGVVSLAVDNGVLVVGSERGLFRSRDGGVTFNDLLLRGTAAFPLVHTVALADHGAIVYAGVSDGLFAAERNSAILEHYEGMPSSPPTQIVPDPKNVGGVVIASRTDDGGAFFSNDIGLTSQSVEALPATQIVGLAREPFDTARLWAATERGLFRLEPGTGIHVSKDGLAALRERFSHEPDLADLTWRALEHQRLDVDIADQQRRAGLANLLPTMRLAYQFDAGDTNQTRTNILFTVGVAQPPTDDPDSVFTDRFGNSVIAVSPTTQRKHQVWLNLTWDLDRVVLPQQTALLGRNAAIAANNEAAVSTTVRSLYIMRRRLLAQITLDTQKGKLDDKSQLSRIHKELEVLEVEARLAGLIGADVFDDDDDASASASASASTREER